MATQIKLLEFPDAGETLLGINRRGVALLDTAIARSLAQALASALPRAEVLRESLDFDGLHTLVGYMPEIDDDPWAANHEQQGIWTRWLHDANEDYLLELFDRRHPDPRDPFAVDDSPALDSYLQSYMAQEMSARELAAALAAHPETLLTATILRTDGEALLRQSGLEPSDRNFAALSEEIAMLYGSGQQHQKSLLNLLGQRLRYLMPLR